MEQHVGIISEGYELQKPLDLLGEITLKATPLFMFSLQFLVTFVLCFFFRLKNDIAYINRTIKHVK